MNTTCLQNLSTYSYSNMMLFVNIYFTDLSDFASVTMTVTFLPGESTASVSVSIVDDSNIEDTEMFTATLTGVSNVVIGSDDTATVPILDDDRKLLTSLL